MLLHGEHDIQILKPLVGDSTLYTSEHRFLDAQDKGKLSVFVAEKLFKHAGEVHIRIIDHLVIKGLGGFGYKGTMQSVLGTSEKPNRKPDHTSEEQTNPGQAFIYRLNGDVNPLHVDPKIAKQAGFDRPILHGLCFFGFSTRAVYEQYCGNDPSRVTRVAVRFTSPVFPGETLIVDMWKESPSKIYFETRTKERGHIALKGIMEIAPAAKL